MKPEEEHGKIEYKLKLIDKDETRINELVTQMRYRCNEGSGECVYNIGVRDDGTLEGISEEEYKQTVDNLNIIASKNNYYTYLLSKQEIEGDKNKSVYELLVREINNNSYIDIKIVIAGNVDSGKSSTVGSLATCKLDDGRGSARASVFNYVHELKSGRTSSIAHVIMGYDKEGNIINSEKLSWSDITRKSAKIINFYDLAGHEKYFRTTIMGITSSHPDLCFIIIAANSGITRMTKEHLFLCVTMGIPFVIIVSKIDICEDRKNVLVDTMASINTILKFPGIRRLPLNIKTKEDIIIAAKNVYTESVVPIFQTSNVTGKGLDNVKLFLNILNKRNPKNYSNDPVEYHIDNTFNVYGFGFVLGGQLVKGKISVGDKLYVGPINGEYETINVRSIHCKKTAVQEVTSGAYVCLGIKKKIPVRRGNVVVSSVEDKLLVKTFKAKITVLKSHSTTIKSGYEPVMCTSCIRETVKIVNIENKINYRNIKELEEDNILRSGDVALVTFEFKYNNHYLKPNTRIILAEGLCKMSGSVTEIL
jgi:GTPase